MNRKETLQKEGSSQLNFKKITKRPLIFVIIAAVVLIFGLTLTQILFNNMKNYGNTNTMYKLTSSGSMSSNPSNPTYNDQYQINLTDYDELLVPSFIDGKDAIEYKINDVKTTANGYNVSVADNDMISASFDNATLIDDNGKSRDKTEDSLFFNRYDSAIINYFGKKEEVTLNNLSLNKLDNKDLYVCDVTGEKTKDVKIPTTDEQANPQDVKRYLVSPGNIVPYRIISSDEANIYTNPLHYTLILIEMQGNFIETGRIKGFTSTDVNGTNFIKVCTTESNGKYREYLTTKEHCIFIRPVNDHEEAIEGRRVNLEGFQGNFLMKDKSFKFCDYAIGSAILGNDGCYYITTNINNENLLLKIPVELYNFELTNKANSNIISDESKEISKTGTAALVFYDKDLVLHRIACSKATLFRLGNYLYYQLNDVSGGKSEYAGHPVTEGIYNVSSIITTRIYFPNNAANPKFDYIVDELDLTGYTMISSPTKISFNVAGNIFGEQFLPIKIQSSNYVAIRTINILGSNFYSILAKPSSNNPKDPLYWEFIVPVSCVTIKGSKQDISTLTDAS